MAIAPELADWLLDADPALRWQVERDLLQLPEYVWRATRARVATEGFGRMLLERQDPEGTWARGAHFPGEGWCAAGVAIGETDEGAQPWVSTDWSLKALQGWGLDAEVLGDTAERIAANCRWEYDDLPYWGGETDVCINAMTLSSGAWLGVDVTALAAWFPAHQLEDGGWNCEWPEGSTRSSFHSTLNAVIGLREYEVLSGDTSVRAARLRGEEYLLDRRLLRRLSTGETVGPWAARFLFPFRWRYSALRAADHFRAAALQDGTGPDPRLAEAIDVIRSARRRDGTWLQGDREPGLQWFETDVPPGEPSKWLTLVGTRVLDWWDGRHGIPDERSSPLSTDA
ncbi:squalene cyclase [Microbacterium sp. JZ31]|uniref:squalene cyclase n=1 Tax=Microbacterium sp. JZ31 TaxID=1906274 RepID=UPI00193296CD|nr:squalene cyclase [Microbacterium sp. JZ31]